MTYFNILKREIDNFSYDLFLYNPCWFLPITDFFLCTEKLSTYLFILECCEALWSSVSGVLLHSTFENQENICPNLKSSDIFDIFCVSSNTTCNGFMKVFTYFLRCSRCSLSELELLNLFKAVRCFLKTSFHIFAFNSLLIMMELFLSLLQHLNIYNLYVNVHYINGHIQLRLYYKKVNSLSFEFQR